MSTLNLLKDKWFIETNSREDSIAVQEWAFAQGLSWPQGDGGTEPVARIIGGNANYNGKLGYGDRRYYQERGHVELFPKFAVKTVVATVVLPEVESPQQKQIRQLEETIARATKQIQELKENQQ